MGIENIKNRETELLTLCFSELRKIKGLSILGDLNAERIGCVSFNIENIHYNLVVRLLNDRFGIQVRGGWSCASTYAHSLFNINEENSKAIKEGILQKNLSNKPGWVRISLHPTMTDQDVLFICSAIRNIAIHYEDWQTVYQYSLSNNEFESIVYHENIGKEVRGWFYLD